MTSPAQANFETFLCRIQSPALRAVAQLWHEARGAKRMPSWTDFPAAALSPYGRLLWSFAYNPETGVITGRWAGDRLGKWVDKNFIGGRLEDLHAPSNYRQAQQLLTKIATTPVVGRSSGRLFTVGDFVVRGERIALPMATDGKTGDGILGASEYPPPPLLGPEELIHENLEWYAI